MLYSFRRCPYAIRARMLLLYAGVRVELREILLRDKPPEMLQASGKGTVPVLVLPDGRVIDESLDVMRWALEQGNPEAWEPPHPGSPGARMIESNDGAFKHWLDRYKYADRHPEHSRAWYREQCTAHLETLEQHLTGQPWLSGESRGFTDVALFPFLRQFSMVDAAWFDACPYPQLRSWLKRLLGDFLFTGAMGKYERWQSGNPPVCFPAALAA